MLKKNLSLALLALFTLPVLAQSTWTLTTPVKRSSKIYGIRVIDAATAFAIDGVLNRILRTRDGGDTWEQMPYHLSPGLRSLWMWDGQRGIVGTENGRFYLTSDGFETATSVTTPTDDVLSIFFVNDLQGYATEASGTMQRTMDGGQTWTLLNTGAPSSSSLFHSCFLDTQVGYVGGMGGLLLRTTDGGDTWTPLDPGTDQNIYDVVFTDAQHGVAVCSAGVIIRTVDGGDSWTPVTSNTTYGLRDLAVEGDHLVAVGDFGALVHSADGGATWTYTNFNYRDLLSVDLHGLGIGMVGGNRILRTDDHGATWATQQEGIVHTLLNKVSFANDQVGCAVGWETIGGFDNGIIRTTDGGRHWTNVSIAPTGVLGVHLRADGTGCFGGSSGYNGHTADFAQTFQQTGTSPAVAVRSAWCFSASTYILAGGYVNAGFYRTNNGGINWSYTPGGNIFDLYFPSADVGYGVGEGGTVYRTTDAGVTWEQRANAGGDMQTVYFLNNDTGFVAGGRTFDGAATWEPMNTPQNTRTVYFTNVDTGYVVTYPGAVLRTTDGGENWGYVVLPLFDQTVLDAAFVDGGVVAVGANGDAFKAYFDCPAVVTAPVVHEFEGTLYADHAEGMQWYDANGPIPGATGSTYEPTMSGSYYAVRTDDQGCTSAHSNTVVFTSTGIGDRSAMDLPLLLPNPAHDRCTVQWVADGAWTITLLDLQGRVVRTIPAQGASATIALDGLRPGAYVVRCNDASVLRVGTLLVE